MTEIGEKLKAARTSKGLQLAEIANRTRINPAYLKSMEEGRFDFLPKPIVIGFLKTFAREVGLDGNALALELQQPPPAAPVMEMPARQAATTQVSTPAKSAEPALVMPRPGFPFLKEVVIGLGVLALMALLLYVVAQRPQEPEVRDLPATEQTQPPARDKTVQEISLAQMAAEAAQQTQPDSTVAPKPVQVTLQAKIKERVWLQVTVDDSLTTDSIYPPGMPQSWTARRSFRIRMGNAGAATFVLEGKDLGVIGPAGQVADLVITPAGIIEKRLRRPQRSRNERQIPEVRIHPN
ncbi:MAG: DUF4115 domain-containing protein [candidate division KSB1 bacterium]|nr:DUF4115 domain-containing protein [candidate division KSB1 bacterium]MDZ7288165.1 DUF4115 domain-containing protein [candidate division KSB1 bacterium]MDZ7300322.1 DUF4115 domain-containing protein [candidate division KSB1 bacterium]MDZ7308672.1 DUF4115 domain-containing protein [candidate division KSB1 bacterium]MDZ7351322.1 DUF4115 domain-containing protein [candidate division KSB1 bacterium]